MGSQPSFNLRDYGIGAQILLDLGITDMTLLSNSQRHVVGLEGYGLPRRIRTHPPYRNKKMNDNILIIEARFYDDIADELSAGAIAELEKAGVSYEKIAVPGALKSPPPSAWRWKRGVTPDMSHSAV